MNGPDRFLLRGFFLLLGLWLIFVAWAQHDLSSGAVSAGDADQRRVLILHEPANAQEARFVAQLAGRFGQPELRAVSSYSIGDAHRFAAVFVMPTADDNAVSEALLADLRRTRRPVLWIGPGVDALFAEPRFAASQGWAPVRQWPAELARVRYKDVDFATSGAPSILAQVSDTSRAEVLAAAVAADGSETPWAIRSGRFAYFAELPWLPGDTSDRHLAFSDMLFELLAPQAPERRRALIRVEGGEGETSFRRLRSVTDLLYAEGVPFELSVRARPGSVDDLGDEPRFASAVRHAIARGGTLALREPLPAGGAPMPPAPYETVDENGALVIPHNLQSLDQARRNLVVRDSMLSYSHRWDADPASLQHVVGELRRLGYSFVGPRGAVRAAPVHAQLPLPRASELSLSAAGWLAALPWIDLPLLVSLLALAVAMWLGGEILLSRLDGVAPARKRRRRVPRLPLPHSGHRPRLVVDAP